MSDKQQQKANKEINKYLAQERKRLQKEIKLLLLGAGDSGKSTIAKQMKIIHTQGFLKEELLSYKPLISENIVKSMNALIDAAENFGYSVNDEDSVNVVQAVKPKSELTVDVADKIAYLWKNEAIQKAYQRRNEFQFFDSADYYFANLDRIKKADYIPDVQDVLRSRQRTTGVIETEFKIDSVPIRMVDVGGQRNERSKWIHCFEGVTAVIFCASLSEYNQVLEEDTTTNRMHESLKLFKEITNNKYFTNTSMILFLNKRDIFADKIKKTDLSVCFPNYKGGNDYDKGVEYITNKFLAQNENAIRSIYVHVTCATDTSNIKFVFDAVKDIILQQSIRDNGLDF